MGIYSYGITNVRPLPSVTDGLVSSVKFRFSRSWCDRERMARQEASDERYIERWSGKSFPILVNDKGALCVWCYGTSPIADDGENVITPLDHKSIEMLPEAELLALKPWVLYAIEAVKAECLDFVPTNPKYVDRLTEYRLLKNHVKRTNEAGGTLPRESEERFFPSDFKWGTIKEYMRHVDMYIDWGRKTLDW